MSNATRPRRGLSISRRPRPRTRLRRRFGPAPSSRRSELEVAHELLARATRTELPTENGERPRAPHNHVGYYLIDRGRAELEAAIHYRPALPERLRRLLLGNPQAIYFGGLAL